MTPERPQNHEQHAGSPPEGSPLFHVVLHEPEIPNNTGNIGRTCVATGCSLQLIHPLGFDTGEKACRRAGLDYWPRLRVGHHDSWSQYLTRERPRRFWFFSTKGRRTLFDQALEPGDALVFGKETRGLPPEMLAEHPNNVLTLPMVPSERSLNLATAVCAVVYEGVRQMIGSGVVGLDDQGRLVLPGAKNAGRGLGP